jgi:putative redox protein
MVDATKVAQATVVGESAGPRYLHHVRTGRHAFLADEPPVAGGADAAPAPFDYLAAALGACTAITLRMYGERKGWDLGEVRVSIQILRAEQGTRIERKVTVAGPLSDEQRGRLADICERTPVTLVLKSGLPIATELA